MTLGLIAFIVLVLTTFFSNGVQAYIHYEAYPLIPFVGKSEFSAGAFGFGGEIKRPVATNQEANQKEWLSEW